jgi:CBS-domain-containing membrane protein
MTAHARCVGPENTLVEAAGLMRELDVGALPVCEGDGLAGMITDRDMALRAIADGRDPNTTTVREAMSPGVVYVFADQEVEEVARVMEERKIRRVPVLNREKRLVGIVSLGDIAISSNPAFSGLALRDVSEPTNPTARQKRLAERSEPASNGRANALRRAASTPQPDGRAARPRRSSTKTKTKRSTASPRSARKTTARTSKRKSTPPRASARR